MFIVPLLHGETMLAARYLVMDMLDGAPVGSLDSHLAFFLIFLLFQNLIYVKVNLISMPSFRHCNLHILVRGQI